MKMNRCIYGHSWSWTFHHNRVKITREVNIIKFVTYSHAVKKLRDTPVSVHKKDNICGYRGKGSVETLTCLFVDTSFLFCLDSEVV